MSEKRDDIDWGATTWEGSRKAQLRHALTLTLRERLEAMEGLADVARRFQELRAQGAFKSAAERDGAQQTTTNAHEPSAPYGDGNG